MISDVAPSQEAFIADALARGLYKDRKELVQTAIELLRRRQEILDEVQLGLHELRTGDCLELDDAGLDALASEIGREGREEIQRESQSP